MAPKRAAPVAAAPVAEEEAAFPRGGGSSISALEAKALRAEGAAQARAEAAEGGARKKHKKNADPLGGGARGFLGTQEPQSKQPRFVELLRFKNLALGMRLWGAVLEVSPRGLTVALPHGLRGRVSPAEASDVLAGLLKKAGAVDGALPKGAPWPPSVPQLPQLFREGQLVRCTVMGLQQGDKHKRVALSLHVARLASSAGLEALQPGALVPAAVKAVEDHGYSLTFGIKGVSGFLKKADIAPDAKPKAGALLDVVVVSAADKRLVTVTAAQDAVAAAVLKDDAATELGGLLPGTLVNARVKAVLSDGLQVSFLTYFTGTVDPFHLGQDLGSFEVGQRVRARVLAVDAGAKTVALSLLRHLVAFSSDCHLPQVGAVYEEAVVQRVLPGLGVVFRLPSSDGQAAAPPAAGFAHISALSNTRVDKVEKAFKAGQHAAVKVIGARPIDGLAVVSARPSVVAAAAAPAQLAAGQAVTGRIASIDDKGAILTLSPGVRAFVPLVHLSDAGGRKGKAKWQVGQEVAARVLEADAVTKRTTATLKKALVTSKLPLIVHLQDAIKGTRTHGTVTGATPTGVFVSFFNGIRGLVHASALGLAEDQAPDDAFRVGQVLKVRVTAVDAAKRRLTLGLATAAAAPVADDGAAAGTAAAAADGADALAALRPGSIVDSATVAAVHGEGAHQYYEVELPDGAKGRLDVPHLADHPAAVDALREAIGTSQGSELGQLLVLERLERIKMVRVTRKASLIAAAAAGALPSELEDVREAALLPGYIASLTADAAYVRFGGKLTGRAGLPQLADSFVSDPARHFAVGQSVRAQVVQVDQERRRFSVTLKPALTASPDAALLASLCADMELAARLRGAASQEDAAIPWDAFPIGGVTAGAVHAHEEFGVTVDLLADENVVGLISPGQEGETKPAVAAPLSARVLDVSKADGIVDLSKAPALLPPSTDAGKRGKKEPRADKWKVSGEKVDVTVQLVKPDYLVVSLPRRKPSNPPTLGFLSTKDYNLLVSAAEEAQRRFSVGQRLQATVAQLPCAETGGRLLMHMAVQSGAAAAAASAAAEQRVASKAAPGRLVSGTVTHASPLVADVRLESGERARLHVTEWRDPQSGPDAEQPGGSFEEAFPEHGAVEAVVVGPVDTPAGRRHGTLELSARPAATAAANDAGALIPPAADLASLRAGQAVQGYVQEVAEAHVWVALSPTLRGRLHAADAAGQPGELADLGTRYRVGQPLRCRVLQVDRATHSLDLSQQEVDSGRPGGGRPPPPGSLVTGRVTAAGGFGLRLRLAGGFAGTAGLCDIHDTYVANALAGIGVGTMVRGCVLEPADTAADDTSAAGVGRGAAALRLSLRASSGGAVAGRLDPPGAAAGAGAGSTARQPEVGDKVHGYVSGVNKAGAFVALRGGATAHVKLSHLADGYVESPAQEFPVGKHVRGHITAKEGSRLEMSLRTKERAAPTAAVSLAEIAVGSIVEGTVRRVEDFGVFVEVGGKGGPCGLAHISEVADGFAADIHGQFIAGQELRAKVLRVDALAGKLSLTLRPSAVDGADAKSTANGDAVDGGTVSDGEADLDEEMAARLDDEAEADAMDGLEPGGSDDDAATAMDVGAEAASSGEEASEDIEDEADLDSELAAAEPAATAHLTEAAPAAEPIKTLDLGDDAGWGDDGAAEAAEDADMVDGAAGAEAGSRKLSKLQKRRAKADKEAAIRQAELARAHPTAEPATAEAFEALVAGQPDASHAWIRYMAFLLTLGDAQGARKIADRALATINYREEDEKFNVWAALLNLENTYGSPPEAAAMATFQKAAAHVDPKKLHLAAAAMFARSGRTEAARALLKAACRKFGGSAKVWLQAVGLELGEGGGGSGAAQKLLDRALNTLPSRKHIKVITQAALAEFRQGNRERGRSLFEGVLRNYPRRLDLWSVYLDQEIKAGDAARTRSLFERAITLQLPPKKMKFLFKRYLEYEQQHGDAARVEHVKAAARDYVETLGQN